MSEENEKKDLNFDEILFDFISSYSEERELEKLSQEEKESFNRTAKKKSFLDSEEMDDNGYLLKQKEDGGCLPIFVYGTLRYGQNNFFNFIDNNYEYLIKDVSLRGYKLCNLCNSFPYIVAGSKKDVVIGDIFRIKKECYKKVLKGIDALEGYYPISENTDNLYERVRATAENGEECWVYVGKGVCALQKEQDLIESGDWLKHIGR